MTGVQRPIQLPIAPFQLERYFARHELAVPYLLCSSDSESWTVQSLLEREPGATDAFHQLMLWYTETAGSLALRTAIAAQYAAPVRVDDVLVHAGAEEGIFNLMQVLLTSDDHAIVHSPCYQSLAEVARSRGCDVTPWPADETNGWALDVDWLASQIRPNTRLIVLNVPHNPTGYLMAPDPFQALIALCRHHGIYLFGDEVYRGLEHHPHDRLPAVCEQYERGISLGVLSKTYGLPGLRIGWLITRDKALFNALAAFKDYTTICNSAPSEFLATLALTHANELIARNRLIVLKNLTYLDRFFEQYGHVMEWVKPKASAIGFPRLVAPRLNAETFCEDLARTEGVLLLPSHHYDYGTSHVRLGFGRSNMPESLTRLEGYLARHF